MMVIIPYSRMMVNDGHNPYSRMMVNDGYNPYSRMMVIYYNIYPAAVNETITLQVILLPFQFTRELLIGFVELPLLCDYK